MKIKCLKSPCKTKIELTEEESKQYDQMTKQGFILSKYCLKHDIEFKIAWVLSLDFIKVNNLTKDYKKRSVLTPYSFILERANNGIDYDKHEQLRANIIQATKTIYENKLVKDPKEVKNLTLDMINEALK